MPLESRHRSFPALAGHIAGEGSDPSSHYRLGAFEYNNAHLRREATPMNGILCSVVGMVSNHPKTKKIPFFCQTQ